MKFNDRKNKLHYKMYKSGKKWIITGIMSTTFFVGIEAINANADTVNNIVVKNNENKNSSANDNTVNSNADNISVTSSSASSSASNDNDSLANRSSDEKSSLANKTLKLDNDHNSNAINKDSVANGTSSQAGDSSSSKNDSVNGNNSSSANSSSSDAKSANSSANLINVNSNFDQAQIPSDPTTIDSNIKQDNGVYHYYNSDGQIQKNILVNKNNKLAFFDSNGNYVQLSNQLPTTDLSTIKNDYSLHNALYSNDNNSITTTNGFLTADTWYRPKDILQNGTNWAASSSMDFRPLLMTWWPNKQVQINYLNYMNANNLGSNNYDDSASLDSLTQGAHDVQSKIEQKIASSGNTDWLKTMISNFVSTQSQWNIESENSNNNDGYQGGTLAYGNSPLTPYANSDYRLTNRAPATQTGKPLYNYDSWNGSEYLLANDVDNSNPVVQAEDLNWLHYLMNIGNITKNDSDANFDGIRIDAVDNMDADLLQITADYFKDAYKTNQNDTNANKHLSILEDWSKNDPFYMKDHGQNQLTIDDYLHYNVSNILNSLPNLRFPVSALINGSIVNRSNDTTQNQAIPNYSFVRAHDSGVQDIIFKIIQDKIDPNVNGNTLTQDQLDQAFKYYNEDMNSTDKKYTYYNIPSSYALMLTNKDTVPRVYYGDMYTDDGQYMTNKSLYFDAIQSMLSARTKYVAGGQSMNTVGDNNNIITSVRYGKDANTANDAGNALTRTSGIALVLSNDPKLQNTQVTINMGAAHKNQAYRPLVLTTNNGTQEYDNDNSAKNNVIYTDSNGNLTLDASQVKGYSNPQVSGYLSMWVPVGANDNQDVRTTATTTNSNDGNTLHSNDALDSNVIFESFSNFQSMPQTNDQYENVVLSKVAPTLKQWGITSVQLPPQYRSVTGNAFVDSMVQNGYAFSDRYDLGYNTPTKYGTIDQLTDAIKSLHAQGMQAIADYVPNQLYNLNKPEVVSVTRQNQYGAYNGNSSIYNDLYYAQTTGGGTYQQQYGGEYLNELKDKYPDLFTTNQISTGKPIDASAKIKEWSAKYLNGTNIQGRGSDYVLRNAGNNQYFMLGSQGTNLPNQLLGLPVETGFSGNNNKVSYYTLSGQPVKDSVVNVNGQSYTFDASGNLITGNYTNNGSQYLSLPNGVGLTNSFYLDNGQLKYFTANGNMYTGGFLNNPYNPNQYLYFDKSGVAVTGAQTIDGYQLYFDPNGVQVKGQIITGLDGNSKYYDPDQGHLVTNQNISVNGTTYHADANGNLTNTQNNTPSNPNTNGGTPNNGGNQTPVLPGIPNSQTISNQNSTSPVVSYGVDATPTSTTSSASSSANSSAVSSESSAASSATSSASSSGSSTNDNGSSSLTPLEKASNEFNSAVADVKSSKISLNNKKNKQNVAKYNSSLSRYYKAEKHYLILSGNYNKRYYYDFDKVGKYVRVKKSAYIHDSKKFTKHSRIGKLKKHRKIRVNKIVNHKNTTRFQIGHNKFITGLKSFIHKL